MLLLSFSSLINYAQEKYEFFQFENNYGIVEINNLTEFVSPTYTNFSDTFDEIVLINGSENTFFNRKTGKESKFTSSNEDLRFNGKYYVHFYKDNASVFIPKKTSDKLYFTKKYDKVIGAGGNLIARYEGKYEVFLNTDFKKPKLENIEASKVYSGFLYRNRTKQEEYVLIFYGDESIYVYDKKLKLIKKYPSNTSYESRMLEAIKEDFKKIDKDPIGFAPMMLSDKWNLEFKDGYTKITSIDQNKSFSIKGEFRDYNIIGNNDWINLEDKQTKMSYRFKINFENNTFIIPKKYQEILELKFI